MPHDASVLPSGEKHIERTHCWRGCVGEARPCATSHTRIEASGITPARCLNSPVARIDPSGENARHE